MHKLVAPLRVPQSKSKDFLLNLNAYRNAHYMVLNKTKMEFKDVMREQIEKLPAMNKVRLTYVLFVSSNRRCDLTNMISVIDKYFEDALVELGKLPDDNFNYVPELVFRFGNVDPSNPRVEIYIEEL